ncbi:MAG: hypothetical protein FP820_05695 [Sulfurimonas sp.]|nr:hypothetical protein [Sulfurimonas sp.]MBU3938992.1 sensor histidine kinase [bacterium]MBU4025891.1 sensor histidine kinase [bacterium]MBU4060194.1 sensor histidine kinase [bacterium]
MKKIIFFLLLSTLTYAIPTVVSDSKKVNITDFTIEYFVDRTQTMSLNGVKEQNFIKVANKASLSNNKPYTWYRFAIINKTSNTQTLYLHNSLAYLTNAISFYETLDQKVLNTLKIDLTKENNTKNMFGTDAIFSFELEPDQTKIVYIKNETQSYQFFNFNIYDNQSSKDSFREKNTYLLLMLGMLLAFSIYHFILYVTTKYQEYLFYTLYLLSGFTLELQLSGLLANEFSFYYNPTNSYLLLSVILAPIFLLLFIKTVFNTKESYGELNKSLNFLLIFFGINFVFGLWDIPHALRYTPYLYVFMFAVIFQIAIVLYKNKEPFAKVFLIANSFFLLTAVIDNLFYLGLLPYSNYTFHALGVGFLVESLALALILSRHINAIRENDMQREKTLQVQEELRRINKELEIKIQQEVQLSREKDKIMFQQRKMASMGEMIENIAHQWRQPLSQVNASVFLIDNIIFEKYKQDDEIEKELQNIENLTEYMSNTINNFKNFFDHNKEKKIFSLEDVLNSSLMLLKDELDKNSIDIIKDIQENIIYKGYLDELQQVFLIIFNNARDIFLSKNIKNPTLIIKIHKTDKEIVLSICDNGGGIKNAIIDKIFDPYFTTKHKTQGTGLGLYMSKVIIEDSMQGNISVKNSKDGACFSILLPLEKEES